MKNKLVLIACFVWLHSSGQVKLGFQAGYSVTKFSPYSQTISSFTTTIKPSCISNFQAGNFIEAALGRRLSLQSGFFVSLQGSHMDIYNGFETDTETVRILYFQIPINLLYRCITGRNYSFFIGAGIYLEEAIEGVEEGTGSDPSGSNFVIDNFIHFSKFDNSHFFPDVVRPFDAGLNLLAGWEHKNVEITARYSHGLTNLSAQSGAEAVHCKNIIFNLSIAYYLFLKRGPAFQYSRE
jgi:hypothetical protein